MGIFKNIDLKLTDEERKIFTQNLKLVPHYIRKHFYGYVDALGFDDMIQIGNIALIRAIKSWNPEKGALSNHAFHTIRGAITHTCRVKTPNLKTITDSHVYVDPYHERLESDDWVNSTLREASLSEIEEKVVRIRISSDSNMTIRKQAEKLGLSEYYYRIHWTNAISKLKRKHNVAV
jgi:RNA polymerase sigma factor (sigma-70 family)